MLGSNPIIFVEDDEDDRMFFAQAYEQLGYKYEIIFFNDGAAAYEFLKNTDVKPFIIFSDINMPLMNGIELRDKIFNNNILKFIPFVFLSTCSTQEIVNHAYSKPVQGYINKPESFEKLKASLRTSIEYWKIHLTPKTE